jgi:L-lactate dehydrogenase (cytochrome)
MSRPSIASMFSTFRSVVRFRRFSWSATERRLARAASVADLRRIAKRRLPAGVFDYIAGGAEDELTMRRNRAAFARVEFRPRVLRDVSHVDPSTSILGRVLPLPLVLGPTGSTRIAHPQGELAVARSAARVGIPYTLSTMANRSIEEVARAGDGPHWFQLYVWEDRGLAKELIQRAETAGYEALVLTVDTIVLGRRERDVRRGFTLPPRIGPDTIVDGVLHPAWTWSFLRSEPIAFANLTRHDVEGGPPVSMAAYGHQSFDASLSWADVEWIRSIWDRPIVLKGIQTVEDAELAVAAGVEAIAVSNHGGRQLDGAPPALEVLPLVADAVGGRTEILCDGGVRRGSDIVKAVALGATAAMAGRAYLYGLGAAGEAGVDHVLRMLDDDVRRTMALCGVASIDELTPDLVRWRP